MELSESQGDNVSGKKGKHIKNYYKKSQITKPITLYNIHTLVHMDSTSLLIDPSLNILDIKKHLPNNNKLVFFICLEIIFTW
jgi:hypothetical protein